VPRWQECSESSVERAISGDHDAFSVLACASIGRLYSIATLILRDGDRAQHAVQDALVSVWRDVRAIRDPDAWDAWLHRLTVRACYRAARRERRRKVVELHGSPESFGMPSGLEFDGEERLWLADSAQHRFHLLDRDGEVLETWEAVGPNPASSFSRTQKAVLAATSRSTPTGISTSQTSATDA
jgi:DNA-directed RNA polymerase specialized sigma24 family protein